MTELMDAVLSARPEGLAVAGLVIGLAAWVHYLYVAAVARRVFYRQAHLITMINSMKPRDKRGRFRRRRA